MKSGLVALVGRPNVGKSTLLNGLVGQKLAIMSDKPQTTRTVVRGVLHSERGQAVLVDTPGLHKPQTLLGRRLNDLVRGTLAEVDLVCLLVDASAGVGRGDRFLAGELARIGTPAICVVNKMDAVPRAALVEALQAAAALGDWDEVVPVSARTGEQLDVLVGLVYDHLPEGPLLYPEGHVTDEPEQHLIAEVIREKALALVRDELPHSVAVLVDEVGPGAEDGARVGAEDGAQMGAEDGARVGAEDGARVGADHGLVVDPSHPGWREADLGPREREADLGAREREARVGPRRREAEGRDPVLVIRATLFVERASQKPIVLGKRGSVLREIGTRARAELEALLGTRVYLDLHVKVAKEWQRDPRQLARLGF